MEGGTGRIVLILESLWLFITRSVADSEWRHSLLLLLLLL